MMQAADLLGQRFVVDFSGPEITPDLERLVRDGRIGGVILFVKNIRSVQQVRALTADLQRLAAEAGLPPLLITIDQEGGLVNRLVEGFTVFPSAMALGASGRAEDAATAGRITALELRSLGINTNHAPVLDVNSNADNPVIGVRAFGDDSASVARLGVAYIRAAQEAGVLTTAKHFPGHGATSVDSHLDLPVVTKEPHLLRREEVFPFEEAVRAGADGILVAHIIYRVLDPVCPASISPQVVTTLLRRELGFEGVVFTDSMAMRAVADRWPRGQAAVAALQAGNDLILACGRAEAQWESIAAARAAAEDGTLDRDALHAAAERIARVKARYVTADRSNGVTGTEVHRQQAQEIADRTVTLVRNRKKRIPLSSGRTAVLYVASDESGTPVPRLGEELASIMPVTVVTKVSEIASGSWDNVVAVSASGRVSGGVQIIEGLRRQFGDRVVVVGAGDPYELLRLPEVDTYLAAYGPDPVSMRAAARVLTGQLTPSGRLPVALPGLYPRGHAA
jgi:beta-N-acetylhexosaminidase